MNPGLKVAVGAKYFSEAFGEADAQTMDFNLAKVAVRIVAHSILFLLVMVMRMVAFILFFSVMAHSGRTLHLFHDLLILEIYHH